MSDYLGNLIARTVSPALAVRPQLPSLFEPERVTREAKSEPEFEPQSFVEQLPVKGSSEKVAPMRLSIPTPRQSILRKPEQTVPDISRAREVVETSHKSEVAVQPGIFFRATPTLHDEKPSNSARCKSDVIDSPPRDVIASALHEVNARDEIQPRQSAVGSKPIVVPDLRKQESQNFSLTRGVVSPVRSLLEKSAPETKPPEAVINVTIGRVEVRAVAPPIRERPRRKAPATMTLEDYLRQRANGGRR
jgi:hypothetical protein